MIKRLYKGAVTLLACVCLVVSCSDDDKNTIEGFTTDKSEINVAAVGGTDNIFVHSAAGWVATASEPWIMVTPANGTGAVECTVSIDSSLVSEKRSGCITFTPHGGAPIVVTVNQEGFGKVINVKNPIDEIQSSAPLDERYYETEVVANVPFSVNIEYEDGADEWLSVEDFALDFDRGARPRTFNIRFEWKMNTLPEDRVALINFVPLSQEDAIEEPAVLSLKQLAALRIEDNRQGDSLALLTIFERLNSMSDPWDTSENMRNWRDVVLWEAADEELPAPEAIGRVRSVEFSMINTEEAVPQEIKYLKYLEKLNISSNVNTMLKSLEVGSELCSLKYLKELTLFSYGIVTLPEEFKNLGATLEYLDLSANNLTSIPDVLTKENFPKLKYLNLIANRRSTVSSLENAADYEDGIGLHFNAVTDNSLRRLLLWDTLEDLRLSNNYIEGEIPDFTPGEEGVVAYTQADVDAFGGDTIQYLADHAIPKILPNAKRLSLNLNFFKGRLPDWLLYHPHLLEWYPELLVFNQQEHGHNSMGEAVGFDNVPTNFDYYYDALPGTREKYEIKENISE